MCLRHHAVYALVIHVTVALIAAILIIKAIDKLLIIMIINLKC